MDQIHLRGKAREESGFLAGGIAAAHHAHGDVAVKRSITSRAGSKSVADELLFAVEAEVARRRAAGNDERLGFHPLAIHLQPGVRAGVFKFLNDAVLKARAEFFRLLMHAQDQIRTLHPLGEAGKIFHGGGGGELAAGLAAFQNKRGEAGAGRVDGRGETGATRPDDNHVFHRSRQ